MRATLILVVCLWPVSVFAQMQTQTQTPAPVDHVPSAPQSTRDPPPGFPYNTGGNIVGGGGGIVHPPTAQVPLRDFLSSRQDLQHAELTKRIDELASRMQQIIDERDRQYAQRFAAQEQASAAALRALQEATRTAEDAANDRFESVNEFRATLADQANNFVNKSTADARHQSLSEKVDDLFIRLNTIQAQREGGAATWGWVVGLAGVAIAFGGIVLSIVVFLMKLTDRRGTVVTNA